MFWDRIANSGDFLSVPPLDQLEGRPLGRVLTKLGKVTREQVIEALLDQKKNGGLLGNVMVRLGFIQSADIPAALAYQRGEHPLPPAGQAG